MPYKVIVYNRTSRKEKGNTRYNVHNNHDDAEHRAIDRGQADKTETDLILSMSI